MKVYIDTGPLNDYPFTGISVYNFCIIEALNNLKEPPELISSIPTLRCDRFRKLKQVIKRDSLDLSLSWIPVPGRLLQYCKPLGNLLSFPNMPMPDLVHCTSFLPPKWLDPAIPFVTTIYDLVFLRCPDQGFVPDESFDLLRRNMKAAADKAAAVITISEFSKREICELLEIPEEKIFVTYLGTQYNDKNFPSPENINETLKKYALQKEKFFLSVSTLSPKKNYSLLLKAFQNYIQNQKDAKLVIVGSEGWHSEDIIEKINSMPNNVIWLKNTPQEELRNLYSSAKAFFLISHYEGFGIPLLEAMELGCPVCYATGNSMDEVAGNAGIKVDPNDLDAVETAFKQFGDDEKFCSDLSQKGLLKAKDFSWESCAEKTLEAYRFALTN